MKALVLSLLIVTTYLCSVVLAKSHRYALPVKEDTGVIWLPRTDAWGEGPLTKKIELGLAPKGHVVWRPVED